MFKALFNLTRSWQKGQQYARNARLLEQRALTERARRRQIMADVEYKKARTQLIEKLVDAKDNRAGTPFLGCNDCGIYELPDSLATHCPNCSNPFTQTIINLKG